MGALYTNHDCILMKGAEWPQMPHFAPESRLGGCENENRSRLIYYMPGCRCGMPNTGFSALVGFGTIYCSSHNDPIRWKRSDQRLWQTGQSLQLYAYYQDFSNNYAPPGRCLCVFHSKWIRTGAKMDFFAKSHPRGDRHTVYAQNRTPGATAIQFMRRIAPAGRPSYSLCAESHPRGDRHTVHAQNRTPGATVVQFMRRMKTPGDQPRELLFLSKRRKGLTHPLRQSLSLTRIPADCRLGKYPD